MTLPPSGFRPPAGFERWNRALQGAYRQGYAAARAGDAIEACPYQDRRKACGRLTWSRAFERAWVDGWHAGRGGHALVA